MASSPKVSGMCHWPLATFFVFYRKLQSCKMCPQSRALNNQALGDQLPEIEHFKIFKTVVVFDVVELAVATVTGHHHDFGAGGLDLFGLDAAVMDAGFVIAGGEGSATPAATELIPAAGIHVDPVADTLV